MNAHTDSGYVSKRDLYGTGIAWDEPEALDSRRQKFYNNIQ